MSSRKKLVIVRGDTSGAWGAIKAYWPLFLFSRWIQFRKSFELAILKAPTRERAIEAIAAASGVVFYGHGDKGRVFLKDKANKSANTDDMLDVAAVRTLLAQRASRAAPKLDVAMIACCDTLRDEEWCDVWLEAARVVRGYDGLTYNWKRPLLIPKMRTLSNDREA